MLNQQACPDCHKQVDEQALPQSVETMERSYIAAMSDQHWWDNLSMAIAQHDGSCGVVKNSRQFIRQNNSEAHKFLANTPISSLFQQEMI